MDFILSTYVALTYIEDKTRRREDIKFMVEWQKQYLSTGRSEQVRYCFCR